jgi:DNA replication protein DnaC
MAMPSSDTIPEHHSHLSPSQLANLHSRMASLGLRTRRDEFGTLMKTASAADMSHADFLDRLLGAEQKARIAEGVDSLVAAAGFPFVTTIESFDFKYQPSLDRGHIEALATCRFVEEHSNVVFLGPTGVGKSHLAVGLGLKAIALGYPVLYTRLDEMIASLANPKAKTRFRARLRRYTAPRLLIIDDVGYQSLPPGTASLFYQVIDSRYEHGSVLLLSDLNFEHWGRFIDDPLITAGLLDRLLHHVTVLSISGRSYRRRNRRVWERAERSLPALPAHTSSPT